MSERVGKDVFSLGWQGCPGSYSANPWKNPSIPSHYSDCCPGLKLRKTLDSAASQFTRHCTVKLDLWGPYEYIQLTS